MTEKSEYFVHTSNYVLQRIISDSQFFVDYSTLCSVNSNTCKFLGLFTSTYIPKGTVIGKYHGKVLRTKDAIKLLDKRYLMRLGEQVYVDAKESTHVLPRYINDCINPNGWNVEFIKFPEKCYAEVVTLRDIERGEEIFASYGR
eukprot:gene13230-17730_t